MSSVQVSLALAVELVYFHNIDLFHQGAFQIRCYLKNNSSFPVIIEPPKVWDRLKNASFPECVGKSFVSSPDLKLNVPCKAVSKSILIIYKEETVRMYDVFEQTMHFQIESLLIEELIYKSEIVLVVELWFGEKKNESFEEMKSVCERQLKVHFIPSEGLHYHTTVMFDYYYLAAVDMVIHATLVSLSPCYLKLPQSSANASANNFDKNLSLYQSWHSILFNTGKNCGRRHTACLIYSQLCRLLISVIESLLNTFQEALSFLCSDKRSKIDEKLRSQLFPFQRSNINWIKFAPNELERLVIILESQASEDDMADQASVDITKLCSSIVVLFNEYLKNASYNMAYVDALSMDTHKLRIKRFSEAFFFQETSIIHLLSVYDPKYANPMYLSNFATGRTPLTSAKRGEYSDDSDEEQISLTTSSSSGDSPEVLTDEHALTRRSSATLVRKCSVYPLFSTNGHDMLVSKVRDSTYYKQLPPLPIECPDTDGQSHDQPIIIEEIFVPEARRLNNQETPSSSSGSDVDEETEFAVNSKKRNNLIYGSNRVIPMMRKINQHFDCKDLPIPEEKVILTGYRSLDTSAFEDIIDKNVSSNGDSEHSQVAPYISTMKQGLGTLKLLYNVEEGYDKLQVAQVKLMSQSLPDLSLIEYKVPSRKSPNIHRNRSNSWACDSRTLSHFIIPSNVRAIAIESTLISDEKDNIKDKVIIHSEGLRSPANIGQEVNYRSSLLFNQSKYLSKSSTQFPFECSASHEDIDYKLVTFNKLKYNLMADLKPHFQGKLYSDLVDPPASKIPYFRLRDVDSLDCGLHYVICVHGLDGEHRDLRLVKTYLSLALPEQRFDFLMSEANEQDNFADINIMKERLVDEIIEKISYLKEKPEKISFIGHSLGCVIIRAAIASPRMNSFIPRFYTFLSLGGPHLGTVYGSSMLVNVGLWVMQKVRKSTCLQQLSMKDSLADLRRCYLYELSGQPGLEYFKYVLLASSPQDRYVPYHSTRIELCRAAVKDNSEMGVVYMEMVTKLLQRLLRSGRTTVVRYDAHYTLPRSANNYIGRAAHIALIDSELFLEKFISVSAAKYFR